jgi:hypothetical protein
MRPDPDHNADVRPRHSSFAHFVHDRGTLMHARPLAATLRPGLSSRWVIFKGVSIVKNHLDRDTLFRDMASKGRIAKGRILL